jgi:hypothetical protein
MATLFSHSHEDKDFILLLDEPIYFTRQRNQDLRFTE